jgi:hypothetical protein
MVREPDHLVFLPEDKFVHGDRAGQAGSTRFHTRAGLGAGRRFGARVETAFVLIAQWNPRGGIDFQD